jgi:predicted GIY-YIG superfamily endonuclease
MTNRSKTLYTGVTNNIERRTLEHNKASKADFVQATRLIDWFILSASEISVRRLIQKSKSRAGCASKK